MDIRKVFLIIKLTLGLVLLLMVVKTATLGHRLNEVFVPASASGTENAEAVLQTVRARAVAEDYSVILNRNIFGDVNSVLSANKSLLDEGAEGLLQPAEQELGIALVGTVSGGPEVSRAVIKNIKTQILDLYRMGQMVAGAYVERIEKNAVVLLHNGQRKTLTLKNSESTGTSFQTPPLKVAAQVPGIPKDDSPPPQVPSHISVNVGQVESLLGKAVIEPYVVKDHAEGLRITGLEGVSAAKDLGLRNGDIICAVNRQHVTSKQKAFQIFKKARSQPIIEIELLRGNESKKLTFNLQ